MTALYPHMLPEDIPVWERFLASHANQYHKIDYDVRTEPSYDPGPEWPDNWRDMARSISARRIDAVGYAGTHLDIIEVTTSAGLTAVGQLTTYPILYQITFKPKLPVRALLVAEILQTGIQDALRAHNIAYILV